MPLGYLNTNLIILYSDYIYQQASFITKIKIR